MTTMPHTNVLNKLLNKAPVENTSKHSMNLWVKASTPALARLAINFISNLPGVDDVRLAKPKPVKFKALLRIDYCLQQTCAEQIAQEAARQGLTTRQIMKLS